jgi:hypothetical protein
MAVAAADMSAAQRPRPVVDRCYAVVLARDIVVAAQASPPRCARAPLRALDVSEAQGGDGREARGKSDVQGQEGQSVVVAVPPTHSVCAPLQSSQCTTLTSTRTHPHSHLTELHVCTHKRTHTHTHTHTHTSTRTHTRLLHRPTTLTAFPSGSRRSAWQKHHWLSIV